MANVRGMAAIALFGWALSAAQAAVGQEPMRGVCDGGAPNGCLAGKFDHASFPAHPPPLFTAASEAAPVALEPSTAPAFPGPSQSVQIDFERLSQARTALAEGRGVELTVNLPDLPLPVVLTGASDTARGYGLTGRVANDPLSSVNIVVNGRSVAGNVWRAGELHTIRTAGAGHYVQTLDGLTMPRCEVEHLDALDRQTAQAPRLQSPATANVAQENGAEDDGSEIDVLVVYTPSGRRSAGGHQSIRTEIEMLVQETNQAYADSDVRQRIGLAAATEVDYEFGNARDALNHLSDKEDGHLDEVHQLRDLYAADLVLLWTPAGGGLAWIILDHSHTNAERRGFSISPSHAFAHELGHNMGLRHERSDDNRNTPYPYSHGYGVSHGGAYYRTIMHKAGADLPRFSNPRHLYPDSSGRPLGVPGDAPSSSPNGPADAARSLNNTAAAVANFRDSATGCRYDLPPPSDVTAEGGSFTIAVATAARCPWEVKALDPGLSIAEGATGKGDGEVVFTVEKNSGWPREVGLRVAGEIHSFRQEGSKPLVSVCDRSINVRRAISRALDGQHCGDMTAQDLAQIGSLQVGDNFSAGDFDGLTGLGSLSLYFGSTTLLNSAIFADAGLDSLRHLRIIVSQGGPLRLSKGAFEGLDALERIQLYEVSWQAGLFEDTPSVYELRLERYPNIAFPDGAFRGLRNLEILQSRQSRVETVGAGTFQGLSSLRSIVFDAGHLTHLAAGAFDGLPSLIAISLDRNRLTTLHGNQFQGAPKLRWISLGENSIRTVSEGAFAGVSLEYLDLRDSDLTSLSADAFDQPVSNTLILSGNRLTTLDPHLFEGVRFWILDFSDNHISDIRSLSSVNYVEEIDLSGNAIVDISPLVGIHGLYSLDLSFNEIVDVSPLAELSRRLTYLDISHNEIADISPLLERDGLLGEGSSLIVYANPLDRTTLDRQVATPRSRGVSVSHIHVWLIDSSAMEGEDFEFVVRLSSVLSDPISFDWRMIVAGHHSEYIDVAEVALPNFLMSAKPSDFSARCGAWNYRICELALVGEVGIGAGQRGAIASIPSASKDEVEERHETFGIALVSNGSDYPDGVALPGHDAHWGTGRRSVAVGFIVDPAGPSQRVPLFLAHGNASGRQSVLRLVSPMDGSPAHVEVFDSLGRRHGATTLSTREALSRQWPDPSRSAVAQFNSEDLEDGNHDAGLSRGVEASGGDWHLKVWANDAQALTYVRHADGFLTSMHDVARQGADGTYAVPTFNPAGNMRQRSVLRLVNPGAEASGVRIVGTDDAGARPGDAVNLSIEPGGARELSAADLESGAGDLRGALGDGQGKWRLSVASDQPLLVASLVESPTGHLTNLSTVPDNKEQGVSGATEHHVPLFLSAADEWGRRSFVRIINKGEAAATVRIRPFDDTVRDYGAVTLTVAAGEAAHFNSHHLEVGGAGLSGGVGAGEGDWRLELEAIEDIDVLSYVRHADGFLTAMHDVVRASPEGHVVPIFNPADDDKKGLLRLVNPRGEDAEVTIRGIDDRGVTWGSMSLVVPAGRSRTISAQEMEAGNDALDGALGDGQGKWRLVVRSGVEIHVMGLLEGPAGHLTNLSTTPLGLDR